MKERIFANYFMHNRYKEYEEFLNTFLKENYKFLCVKEYEKPGKFNHITKILQKVIQKNN